MVLPPDHAERFQKGYLARFLTLVKDQTIRPPPFQPATFISAKAIEAIPSAKAAQKKQKLGLPIVLFPSASSPVLLTTQGVFFSKDDDQRGYWTWDELSIIAGPSLASDDLIIEVDRDVDRYEHNVPRWIAPAIYGIICLWIILPLLGGGIFASIAAIMYLVILAIVSPFAIWFLRFLSKKAGRIMFQHGMSDYFNILRVGHRQKIDMVRRRGAADLGECIVFGMIIFRKQREKYGIS